MRKDQAHKPGTSVSAQYRLLSILAILLVEGLIFGCGGGPGTVFFGSQAGGSSGTTTFTVVSATPNSGPAAGGTQITVTGTNFPVNDSLTVTFGGTAATSLVVNSASSITVTTPAHAAGTVDVVVTDTTTNTTGTLTGAFTYTSGAGGGGTPLSITSTSPLPNAALNVAFSTTITTAGGSGGAKQFSISAGAMPLGLTLGASTGLISGTPTQGGPFNFTVSVTDSSGSASQAFTLTVGGAIAISTTSPLPNATLGISYHQQLSTTGGSGTKTWAITTGALPTGMIIQSSTGVISGAPNVAGPFTFTVTVSDSSGNASMSFSLTVDNVLPGGQIAISSCATILTSNNSYQLQNDITSTGTCLSIQGHDVILDLNGHSITYGTASGTQTAYGILAVDCFDGDIVNNPSNPCTNGHSIFTNITIAGNLSVPAAGVGAGASPGKVIESLNETTPFSHAIRFGQAALLSGVTVQGVDITIQSPSTFGIFTNFSQGGSTIFNNTIHNNVTVEDNRQHFDSLSIKLDNERLATIPNMTHHNLLIGGAQGGLRETNNAGSKVFNNDISMAATYSNDFCIDTLGDNEEIFNNNCHPTEGRGLHLAGNNVSVHDNIVTAIEKSNNQEYGGSVISINRVANVARVALNTAINPAVGNTMILTGTAGGAFDGTFTIASVIDSSDVTLNSVGPDLSVGAGGIATACQAHGTYGIQVESDQVQSGVINVFNNTVTAIADECDAQALKLTTILPNTPLNIHDNTFIAKRIGNTVRPAIGLATDAIDATQMDIHHNTWTTDTEFYRAEFDGSMNFSMKNDTIAIGSNPASPWFLVDFHNFSGGSPSSNIVIQDPVYQNGASDASLHMVADPSLEEFFLNWTTTIQITDASHANAAVAGATVTIKDITGTQVFNGTTDANGMVQTILTQRHVMNSAALAIVPPDPLTPHTVSVTKTGCTPAPDTFLLTVGPSLPPLGTPFVHALATCP